MFYKFSKGIILGLLAILSLSGYADKYSKGKKSAGRTLHNSTQGKSRGANFFDSKKSRIHMSIDAGLGVNTNPYSLPSNVDELNTTAKKKWDADPANAGKIFVPPVANPLGIDMIMKIMPNFSVSSNSRKLKLDLGFNGSMDVLPDVADGGKSANFSLFTGNAYGEAKYDGGGIFSYWVRNDASVSRNPSELFVGATLNVTDNFNVGLGVKPGGGALKIKADFDVGFTYWPGDDFFVEQIANPSNLDLNTNNYGGRLSADWKFMPQTSFLVKLSGAAYNLEASTESDIKINPLGISFGLEGRLSKKVKGGIHLGYSNPLLRKMNGGKEEWLTTKLIGVTGSAHVEWAFSSRGAFSAGYNRAVAPVPYFYYTISDSLNLDLAYNFADKISFKLSPSAMYLTYGLPQAYSGQKARKDLSVNIAAELMYNIRNWLAVGLQGTAAFRWTNADALLIYSSAAVYAGGTKFNYLFNQLEAMFVVNANY